MTGRSAPDGSRRAGSPRRHLAGSMARAAVIVVLALVAPALIIEGDLLVLPAAALVLLCWAVIGLVALVHWLATVGGPPVARTAATAGAAGWAAIVDDPIGAVLHRWAGRVGRVVAPARGPARWLGRRLGVAPTGLPLTISAMVATTGMVGLLRLGHLADQPRSTLSLFDLRVAEAASRLEVGGERRVMEALTNVGATRSILVLAAVLVAGALVAHRRHSAVLAVAPLAISSGLVTILKVRHARPRPALGQLVEHSTSFPSGHAAASLSLAFGVVLWWWAARRRRCSLVAGLVIPLALLVGYSRAYLQIHWLSDVVAGWLCAAVGAAVTFGGYQLVARRGRDLRPSRPAALRAAGLAAALVVAIVAITGSHASPTTVPPPTPTRLTSIDPAMLVASVPRFSETLLGRRMEPLGLVIVANEASLRSAIDGAGWTVADRLTPGRLVHTYWAGLTGQADATAPVTPTFLDTRLQDLAIQRQSLGRGVKARHHARLWRLPLVSPGGCPVWAVTASLDDRVEWTLRTLFPNHHIDPAIDTERDYLAGSLARTGALEDRGRFDLVGPTLGTNAAGDPFFTDGKVAVLDDPACR